MKKNIILGLLAATSLFVFSCGPENDDDDIMTSPSGSFTDSRDNQTYATIFIGGQTWMAEDLKFDTGEDTASVCYENSADSCEKYGMLYNWQAANEVCPEGYHLPDTTEVLSMLSAANIELNSSRQFIGNIDAILLNGNSKTDFQFGGRHNTLAFGNAGTDGYYWLSTSNATEDRADYLKLEAGAVAIPDIIYEYKFCVRCVKD